MKNIRLHFAAAILSMLVLSGTLNAVPQVYDLKADWSDIQNPNGPWAFYREASPGSLVLLSNTDPFAWSYRWDIGIPGEFVHILRTAIAQLKAVIPEDIEFGDIFCLQGNGGIENALFIEWTAPKLGTINVSGEIWNTVSSSIINGYWRLDLAPISGDPNDLISDGVLVDAPRSNPLELSSGFSGPGALLNIPVQAGDRLLLHFPSGYWGRIGLNLSVAYDFNPDEPVPTILAPASGYLAEVGESVSFEGTFEDDDPAGSHTAEWIFSRSGFPDTIIPGTVSGYSVSDAIEFLEVGVYATKLVVNDTDGYTGEATTVNNDLPAYVVVYDPDGGFVTGGGYVNSGGGSLYPGVAEFLSYHGAGSFGFYSKYKKGTNIPTGQTEFQFQVFSLGDRIASADLVFHSTSYEWLVVAGARAMFKGVGTVNGGGEYGFMVTATDSLVTGGGDVDRFRIKIWEIGTDVIVYDNQAGSNDDADLIWDSTIVRRGNIVIHAK